MGSDGLQQREQSRLVVSVSACAGPVRAAPPAPTHIPSPTSEWRVSARQGSTRSMGSTRSNMSSNLAREAAGPSFAEVQMGEHQPAPVDQGGVSTVQAAAGLLPPSCVVAGSGRREPARGNGAVAEAEPRVLTAAELQQHLLALLRAEHKLECPAREAPAPAGLLDLLTQDGAWELLSAHRSARGESNQRLAALRNSSVIKSQDILGALLKEVAEDGGGSLLVSARRVQDAGAPPESPLSRFLTETGRQERRQRGESAFAIAMQGQGSSGRKRRSVFACFGF